MCSFELTDATVLRDKFGLEHEDVWQTIFLIVHNKEAHLPHFLFKCVYFELPLKVPSSLSSKVQGSSLFIIAWINYKFAIAAKV